MRRDFEAGTCTFCQLDRNLNRVQYETPHWRIWEVPAQFLRKELALHLLMVPVEHVRFTWDLSTKAARDQSAAQQWIKRNYGKRVFGGVWVTRVGDMQFNAGTVPHLHHNLMVPNGTGEVRIPVYKKEEDLLENAGRAAGFGLMYEAGQAPV